MRAAQIKTLKGVRLTTSNFICHAAFRIANSRTDSPPRHGRAVKAGLGIMVYSLAYNG